MDDYVCLKIRGIPFASTKEDIMLFFQNYGMIQDSVKFGMH